MKLLALDVGSSSVKAAILRKGKVVGRIIRRGFETDYALGRAEVKAADVLAALAGAIADLGSAARKVETIGLTTMAASWVAMDKKGKAITPVITHQDRRSVDEARELENRVGKARHLRLAGNRPFPGGISSTTWAWHVKHAPQAIRRADLVGHLTTLVHRHLTHSRVIDPSHASFMGLYSTVTLDGWNDELIEAVGASEHVLPQIMDADAVGGLVTREGQAEFGLTHGTPVLVGCVDGSAPALMAGAQPGQLINACGSTDVLALCTDRPAPHERLLTRALGVGKKWLSVSTVASSGSSLMWAREQLFSDLSEAAFRKLLGQLARKPRVSSVRFDPYLAGDRMSVEQKQGAFVGLTLSTTREQMLSAIIEALARASAERLPLLAQGGVSMKRKVLVTGGVSDGLDDVLHRDWPGKWTFEHVEEATLLGVGKLIPNGL